VLDGQHGACLDTGTTLNTIVNVDRNGFAVPNLIYLRWADFFAGGVPGAAIIIHLDRYLFTAPLFLIHRPSLGFL